MTEAAAFEQEESEAAEKRRDPHLRFLSDPSCKTPGLNVGKVDILSALPN
jgi:hypothetical protein